MEGYTHWIAVILVTCSVVIKTGDALLCYKCLSMNTSKEIGDEYVYTEIRGHVRSVLNEYYYFDNGEADVEPCPPPNEIETWNDLETRSPWNRPCGAFTRSEATCALGRFQVKTTDHEGKEFVLHGTILGCAKRQVRNEAIVEIIAKTKPKTYSNYGVRENDNSVGKETTSSLHTCGLSNHQAMDHSTRLVHNMELEHCAKASDLCQKNFCVKPEESEVRIFLDDVRRLDLPWTWIILAVVTLGALIGTCSMLGLKYS